MTDASRANRMKQVGFRLTTELIEQVNKDAFEHGNVWASHIIEDRLRSIYGLPPIHSQSVAASA